jgi:AcrR family transcriptional regulator
MRSEKLLTRTQQVRRDDILKAAIEVIDRDGYHAASIARIAVQADTSKSTVLYHFKTRAAIDEAVVVALFADGAAYMASRLRAAGDTKRDWLRTYLESNLEVIAQHPAHIRAVHAIETNVRFDPAGDGPVVWLEEFLRDGQQSGEFDSRFDPHVVALTIRAVIDAAAHHLTEHPDLDITHYTAEIVHLFERATGSDKS